MRSKSSYQEFRGIVESFAGKASKAELIVKRDEVIEAMRMGIICDPDAVRDARAAIKVIEREMVSRWEVGRLNRRRLAG